MNCKHLPEGYTHMHRIDLAADKKLFIAINALNFAVIALFEAALFLGRVPIGSFRFSPVGMLSFLIGMVAVFVLHELIHGLFFYIFSREKITYGLTLTYAYAGNPNYHFDRNSYLIIGLAPSVLISAALLVALMFVRGGAAMIVYQLFAIHLAGCVGDFYVSGLLLKKYPPSTLIRDAGVAMDIYTKSVC